MFKVPVKQLISYKSEICFMAIILASDNIKRLVDLMHYRSCIWLYPVIYN